MELNQNSKNIREFQASKYISIWTYHIKTAKNKK